MQRQPAINPSAGSGSFVTNVQGDNSKALFYNESPFNIDLDFLDGRTDVLHAWEANWWDIDSGDTNITWQIDADSLNVTNPPISSVFLTTYGPNEQLRGTYPMALVRQASVGNPGGVPSNVSNLSNEGNPINQLVIDIGDVNVTQLIQMFTDHFIMSVDQAGLAHFVLRGQTTGSPALLGQTGDTTEVAGSLKVDQNLVITGAKVGKTTAGDIVDGSGASDVYYKAFSGSMNFQPDGTNTRFQVKSTGPALTSGNNFSFLAGTLSRVTGSITTCGSGTVISHGMGVTPDFYGAIPVIAQPGSATLGINNGGTSTFTATIGAGVSLTWIACKGNG